MPDPALFVKTLATVRVIDVADTARRLFGEHAAAIAGRPLAAHDYRFSMKTPGGEVTFKRGATAEDIVEYCKREGWLPVTGEVAR